MVEQVVVQTREQARDDAANIPQPPEEASVESELLVEEVSIDGMCGVY